MCLTTLDLEDFFSQSFFAFEKWKEKMKKNDATATHIDEMQNGSRKDWCIAPP